MLHGTARFPNQLPRRSAKQRAMSTKWATNPGGGPLLCHTLLHTLPHFWNAELVLTDVHCWRESNCSALNSVSIIKYSTQRCSTASRAVCHIGNVLGATFTLASCIGRPITRQLDTTKLCRDYDEAKQAWGWARDPPVSLKMGGSGTAEGRVARKKVSCHVTLQRA